MITTIMPVFIQDEETLALTKAAIESIQTKPVFWIIVDNASSVGGGYLRSISHIYIRNQTNLGYARAVNQGLALKNTELVAIANNDIRVSPNWQEVAKEVFISPQIYSCHFKMLDYDEPFQEGISIAYSGKERWCTSSFFVLNTKKYLFYYDEEYLNSYDDWDYWHTVRLSHLRTAYTDKASYQHKHSHTQIKIPERDENDKRNREYFKSKWGKYAEELFADKYPHQMEVDYREGFNL